MLDHSSVTRLDDLLRSWERDRSLSGTALLTAHGRTVFEGCYGHADRAAGIPVAPRTRFGLASVTKMFTAVAVADQVAQGRLRFDQPVIEVLPAPRRPSTLRDDVTVHHLLCHTSGIADYSEEDEDTPGYVEDYGSLWQERPSYSMQAPVDFLPLFGDLPPYRAPGERHQYSNAGFIVLGLLVEEVAGRPFTEVVDERVLARAGMTSSGFFRLDEAQPDVAVGYLPRTSPQAALRTNVYSVPVVGGPDGGAFATTGDLDRFLTAYDDGTLLGDLRDTMLHPHADMVGMPGFRSGYGVHLYPDGRYGHGGGDPGVEVLVHRWPSDGVNLVVLCNMEDLAGSVRDAMVEAWQGGLHDH
jgi:CubicO group peptidase (beta-lactamase class C family)